MQQQQQQQQQRNCRTRWIGFETGACLSPIVSFFFLFFHYHHQKNLKKKYNQMIITVPSFFMVLLFHVEIRFFSNCSFRCNSSITTVAAIAQLTDVSRRLSKFSGRWHTYDHLPLPPPLPPSSFSSSSSSLDRKHALILSSTRAGFWLKRWYELVVKWFISGIILFLNDFGRSDQFQRWRRWFVTDVSPVHR